MTDADIIREALFKLQGYSSVFPEGDSRRTLPNRALAALDRVETLAVKMRDRSAVYAAATVNQETLLAENGRLRAENARLKSYASQADEATKNALDRVDRLSHERAT